MGFFMQLGLRITITAKKTTTEVMTMGRANAKHGSGNSISIPISSSTFADNEEENDELVSQFSSVQFGRLIGVIRMD